ncbi:hypothetical protein FRC06_010341 [Ceratobasidium sp. 370]|nr:hypothetical protein FRC06_010341 [Ceratobasidium sp. 370]
MLVPIFKADCYRRLRPSLPVPWQSASGRLWRDEAVQFAQLLNLVQVAIGAPSAIRPSGRQYVSYPNMTILAEKPMNGQVIESHIWGTQAIAITKQESFGMTHIRDRASWYKQLEKVIGITEKSEAN